jgi:hypothetical protein
MILTMLMDLPADGMIAAHFKDFGTSLWQLQNEIYITLPCK